MLDDHMIDRIMAQYPLADISPAEFEEFVVELLRSASARVDDLEVTLHDKIGSSDGTNDFDAAVRFKFAGLQFLVLVEAKKHKFPVKRDLVQVLHQKVQSVGAHKGVMISTARFQSGAVKFAIAHGVALATVTEGRFTFESRAADQPPPMSRTEALEQFGVPIYVGQTYSPGNKPGSISTTLLSPEYPEYVVEMLTGQPVPDP